MLKQELVQELLAAEKAFVDPSTIQFPIPGELFQREIKSKDNRESFMVDVNRKGKIKLTKCTYQERYAIIEILLRLDIDGPPHENPDGQVVPTPHLHIYREGFGDKWAIPAPVSKFTDTTDLVKTLKEFLKYCNVSEIPPIQKRIP